MTAHTASSKERLYAAIDLKSFYASILVAASLAANFLPVNAENEYLAKEIGRAHV